MATAGLAPYKDMRSRESMIGASLRFDRRAAPLSAVQRNTQGKKNAPADRGVSYL